MSRIRSGNTKPEEVVRSLLHAMGYRFRLHRKDFPGKPDIVLPKYKTVILYMDASGIGIRAVRMQPCQKPTPNSGKANFRKIFDRDKKTVKP